MARKFSCRLLILMYLLVLCGTLVASIPTFDHLTVGDGLSHNTVYALIQDRSGMFWIGTRYGLNRYDGYNFRVFTPEDEVSSINGPTVISLLEDRRGRIWAGHRDAGISIYDKTTGCFTPFSLSDGGAYPVDWSTVSVRSLFQDSRGYIWIGTFGAGTIILDGAGKLLHHLSTYSDPAIKGKISSDFVFDFKEDEDGNVYVATSGKGLNFVRWNESRLEVLHAPDADDLNSFDKALCIAQDGRLWIATSGSGLYRYSPKEDIWKRYRSPEDISHPIVTDVVEDSKGNIWTSTDGGGLNLIHPETGVSETFTYSATRMSSLNTNALYSLLLDKSGALWAGSFNGGLNVHRSIQLPFINERRYDHERKIGLRSVLAITEDESGTTWFGTDGGGLFFARDDISGVQAFDESKAGKQTAGSAIDKVITALQPVGKDGLWLGSYAAGLSYLDLLTGTVTKYRHDENDSGSLAHNNVWDLEIDSRGGVWAGLLGGGLDYLPAGASEFRHFTPVQGDTQSLSGLLVLDLLLDRDGQHLWIATEKNGLNRLHLASGKIRRFEHEPDNPLSLSSNYIRHLFQDDVGTLWVATEHNGLNALAVGEETFTRYDKANGYPFEMVSGIETDASGNFWITGLKEIFRWTPKTSSVLKIPREEEIGYNLYNPGAIQKLKSGKLVFGGVNGFSVLQPDNISTAPPAPSVVIADFQLTNSSLLPGQYNGRTILDGDVNTAGTTIRLNYQDRGIAFYFAAPAHPSPEELRYAFRLNGFDEDWNLTEPGQRMAYYSSLKGGEYTLEVKAAGGDGVWGAIHPPLSVSVKPPFWQTNWFIVSMVLLGLLTLFSINRFLLSRQRERYVQEAAARDQEILRLKNRHLKEEVASKQSELGASLLQMAHKNEFLTDLKNKIQQLKAKEEAAAPARSLRSLVRVIDHELKQEDYWEQFQLIFDQGYQEFVSRLREQHPKLSNNDSRLCCLIRMKLNNREIASVLNITLNGVEQAKYRLKRKLGLPRELGLNDYVGEFG